MKDDLKIKDLSASHSVCAGNIKMKCAINTLDMIMHTFVTITNKTTHVNINYMEHNNV